MAFCLDLVDAAAHGVLLVHTAHEQLALGGGVPPSAVVAADVGGLAAALISTTAAVTGEALAARHEAEA